MFTHSEISSAALGQPFLKSVNGGLNMFKIETQKGEKKKDDIICYIF